jgi:Holliday junction resolvasome RuvABC endonuclease subunit
MNEAGTRAEHIDPALKAAGWGVVEGSRMRCKYAISAETQRLEAIYQQKLAALDDLKKSLLHRAFSGLL